jgi:REP element-mobilizing transposase RayT
MPWGLNRFQQSGQTHFVTFCCYCRRESFTDALAKHTFEVALERVRRSFQLRVYGYVVMPEHVHLLIGEPQGGNARRCAQVVEAGRVAAIDRRGHSLLAKALLRFQRSTTPLKPTQGLSGRPATRR